MSNTGIMADTATVECAGNCGGLLIVPVRLLSASPRCFSCEADRTDAEARAAAEKVKRGTDKTTNSKGRDGR